jgi:hypothetical protein
MMPLRSCFVAACLGAALIGALAAVPCQAMPIIRDGKPAVTIVLAADAVLAERTAAQELADYLGKAGGGKFTVVGEAAAAKQGSHIYVGSTALAKRCGLDPSAWGPEQWAMRTVGEDLVLVGGRPRGTLYAVYRFLEDVIGVRWWSPYEEYVPKQSTREIAALDRRGKPRFNYRDICQFYADDQGRFAARNRVNGRGFFGPSGAQYGTGIYYGPPNGVHTFYLYISPQEYFEKHPEWFSLIDGKRTSERAQLCLTNPQVRGLVIEKLKGHIEKARADAQRAARVPPVDFDISQNDWLGMCQCEKCQAIADKEGSQSGPLLDFLNYVADAIRDQYPEVRINTLAYQMTENPPKTIRPRENIIPRLCDTNANELRPITHRDNRPFAERLAAWGQVCKTLRIWDYAVAYGKYPGLPLPTVHTYPIDYRFYAEHNIEGVFTEHEYAVLADMRDLKIWMMMKLLEDPYRDYDALLRDFTDGFYGPAGPMIRRYLADLQAAAEATTSNVNWFPAITQYRYLTLEFLCKAQAAFDTMEKAVAGDRVLLRRVRHARLPVDRACIVLWPRLKRGWIRRGGQPEKMPLDLKAVGARCRETWLVQIDLRFPESQRAAQRAELEAELSPLLICPAAVPLPKMFINLPLKDVFDFTAEIANIFGDSTTRVPDKDAECGITNRLELPDAEMQRYKLPMPWGIYDQETKRGLGSATIRPEDVAGPGYHWYKLGMAKVTRSAYVWFFWSWVIQFPIESDPKHPDQKFEVWARVKFEGPAFPHGTAGQKNAICVERLVQVKTAK